MDKLEIAKKREKEKNTVRFMIQIYCNKKHKSKKNQLCEDCSNLANYAIARVEHCPYMETKTFCSSCKRHCYKPEMREKIKNVMRFSGPRMIIYNPKMAIKHVFEGRLEK